MPDKIIITVTTLLLVFGISFSWQTQDSAEEFSVNGLKVILKTNKANEIVSAQLYLKGGSSNIDDSTQGIEPLIFNSALKGSKNYPKEMVNTILDKTAARIYSHSNRDFSSISMYCLNRHFDETWKLFADIILNPAFEEQDVEIVRDQLLVDIRQRSDSPDEYLFHASDSLFYKDHIYRLDPNGTEASMSHISIKQMKEHLQSHLQTSQLLLVVVGNIAKEKLRLQLQNTFGNLRQGNYQPVWPAPVVHIMPGLKIEKRDLPTNYISGYFSAPALKDKDFYIMTMAVNILSWRIWEEVRTKRNLSYVPRAFLSDSYANHAAIYVSTVDPDTTIKVMLAELRKLREEPVSEKDLQDRITMYLSRYYLNNETNGAQAEFLARYELCGTGWQDAKKYVENLRKVTAEQVKRVANEYFHNIQFVTLGNPDLIDYHLFTSM